MKLELNINKLDNSIKGAVLGLSNNEDAIIFRRVEDFQITRSEWVDFLMNTCGLTLDKRHYSIEEKIVSDYWWEISNQPDKENSYAYSTTAQPFHNDNAWFQDAAEINFFYMEKQAVSGGEQLIYPLSRLIDDLCKYNKMLFDDLISTTVTISKGVDDFQNTTPIITLDDGGRIYWNYYRTIKVDPFINELCERFFSFLKNQENSNSVYSVRCESGDAMAFNDQRLLHARNSFVAISPRDRILYQSMWRLPSGF